MELADPHACTLVSDLDDIRWLSGFSGSNALLVIRESESVLLTDGRYREQAAGETQGVEVRIIDGSLFSGLASVLGNRSVDRIFIQPDRMTVRQQRLMTDMFPDAILADAPPLFRDLRALKSAPELEWLSRALAISEAVFESVAADIKPGMSEREIASEIDYRQRQKGADGPAFETIAASGPNSALPHARPGDRLLRRGEPLLLDYGCIVEGYRSDITRMIHIGKPDDDFMEIFRLVQRAQATAIGHACAGLSGKELDAAAREVITSQGYGKEFSHSLGHGIGLETHEWPTISKRGEEPLPAGCVITIEPGVYLAGRFGIRLENMIRLEEGRADVLNSLTVDLRILD